MTPLTEQTHREIHNGEAAKQSKKTMFLFATIIPILVIVTGWAFAQSNRLTRVETKVESIEKTVTQIHNQLLANP